MITIELFTEVKLLKNLTGFENLLGLEPKTFKVHKDVDFGLVQKTKIDLSPD